MTDSLPSGFLASGSTCGIKDSGKPDLCLFVSEVDCAAAGVYTTNRVVGAPVVLSRQRTPGAVIRGVVINSGNANACTGESGDRDAHEMTAAVAQSLGCLPEQILVCSTGIIGVPLPMDKILNGIPTAVEGLSTEDGALTKAAAAMMTTDTFAKSLSQSQPLSTGSVSICGAAKGAAMIAPNMATMLGVVLTDAVLTPQQCDTILKEAVSHTFNCITVDGHMSTSDTVLLLANGQSGITPVSDDDVQQLTAAVRRVCEKLATDIIRDAEGAAHFVTVDVRGFATRDQAVRVARQISESALVKTAITGNDPNWGRITSAAGYAGIPFDAAHLSLQINGVTVYKHGNPVAYDEVSLSADMQRGEVSLLLELTGGPASGSEAACFWTSDLTQEYVRLNSEYTT
ncbi:MAG: bifunctional glutamate N-acetyltransferase/amino-acid acetyltransferase ArgJ [Planctomycetaceae bacterium]|nr:bifunctional glutamate N-acetyltransferase/amino-acid acetyltransferase ArgJ [Planctomycetaceae bacterium]